MRKWYGAGERLPTDGGLPPPEDPEPEKKSDIESLPRDYVLVTDAESSTGEQVVLQLILARAKVKVLVRDVVAAKAGYGPYVEAVSLDARSSQAALVRVMCDVQSLVLLGELGGLLAAAKAARVERLVLLSTAGMPQPGGLAALFGGGGGSSVLRDAAREAAVAASGVAHVIVKAGDIRDMPGGESRLLLSPTPVVVAGTGASAPSTGAAPVSREDLACALVRALEGVPQEAATKGLAFQVASGGPGVPPEDWQREFAVLASAAGGS